MNQVVSAWLQELKEKVLYEQLFPGRRRSFAGGTEYRMNFACEVSPIFSL